MSVFDKLLGLDDDDEYYDDEDLYEDDYEDEKPKKKLFSKKKDDASGADNSVAEKKAPAKFTPIRSKQKGSSVPMEVCIIKPNGFEDSKDVVNTILSGRTVILNIEGLDIGIAQRIIDFTSGASFSIGGTLQKVSNYIFVVTPDSVDVSGDLAGIMDAFDFSGVQTGFN